MERGSCSPALISGWSSWAILQLFIGASTNCGGRVVLGVFASDIDADSNTTSNTLHREKSAGNQYGKVENLTMSNIKPMTQTQRVKRVEPL